MTATLSLGDARELAATWRAGVLSLPEDRVPCEGLIWSEPGPNGREGIWRHVRNAMLSFLDEWGRDAARLGWSTEALFGVHQRAAAYRSDSTGALVLLYPRRCIALSEREIHLERRGSVVVARGLTNPAESVAIWDFRRT